MIDRVVHKWLKLPYTLHSEVTRGKGRRPTTIVLIHGIGESGEVWRKLIDELPASYRVITVDLLGFGRSPQPTWAIYNAKTQARSLVATLLKLRLNSRLILIGHSLGSLVAVEATKRYPLSVKALVLCNPPFYNIDSINQSSPNSDNIRARLYRLIKKHPDQFVTISILARRLGIVNKTFNLTRENATIYMNVLESSILNQTAMEDAKHLKAPIHIIYGSMDPIVVVKNLKTLAKANTKVRLTPILASHEITKAFVPAIVKSIEAVARDKR